MSGSGLLSSAITTSELHSVSIRGNVVGTLARPFLIGAYGSIAKLAIGGDAEFLIIDCGGTQSTFSPNPDAQIGSVTVGGNWIASSIAAGVAATNGLFGDSDDTKVTGSFDDPEVVSRIASITIKGRAFGTIGGTDHFGFVAQKIGSLTIGGEVIALAKRAGNDDLDANDPLFLIGTTNDMRVHEIAL